MKKISLKLWVLIIALSVLGVFTFRFSGNSVIYMGFIITLIEVILIGLLSNRWVGSISGGLILGLGILSRVIFPITVKLKKDKLADFLSRLSEYQNILNKYFYLFILLSIVIGFLAGLIGERIKNKDRTKFSTLQITYISIFIALSVLINTLRAGFLSFGGFPIIFSGYLLGPYAGFVVGGVSDVLGFLVRPSAFAFNPVFTLTSALTGLIPAFVTNLLKEKYPDYSFIKILIGIFIGQMLTSVILVPIFSVMLYGGKTLYFLMGRAFIKQITSIPIYAMLIKIINDRLKNVIDFKKEFI